MCTTGLIRHMNKRGNGTVIWVVNTEEEFEELREKYGGHLDGVMTDMPSVLANYSTKYINENRKKI